MDEPLYILAGGGTGGHLYPGLAVAHQLRKLRPGARIVFACSDRPIDAKILAPLEWATVPQPVLPIPRRLSPLAWARFGRAWRRSVAKAGDMVRDLRPRAVLGLGGFAAGPVVRQAARAGVATALLNPDAVPGKANQYLARRVEAIFTQFDATAEHFPPAVRRRVRAAGCPIRSEVIGGDRSEALRHFELSPEKRVLLVFGGSLLAESLVASVAAMAGELGKRSAGWQVVLISNSPRAGDYERELSGAGVRTRRLDYCDRMDLAYAAADLAITRGGAVTVAELAATATPAVILPYPHHRDQQQRLNAGELVDAGAALIVEDVDPAANAAALSPLIFPVMDDPSRLGEMRKAAGELARPDAAAEVARWLLEHA
jgi:UDP-N-acetylglucosamine--N-acetylmuramyl-(pentapeptide) pyrophosphoryl-undecaprenol N-acetylglucosamine transferase